MKLMRVARLVGGAVIGFWLARYLEPAQFGQLNYALSFISIFAGMAALGMQAVVVRDLVADGQGGAVLLGSALAMQVGAGLLACVAAVACVVLARPGEASIQLLVAVLSPSLIFRSSEVLKYWFESQMASRRVVLTENAVFFLALLARAVLILIEAPLFAFALMVTVESLAVAAVMYATYRAVNAHPRAWRFSSTRAVALLRDSWPLAVASVSVLLYMRMDQLMIGMLLDDEAVGLYSAAARLSEAWYFVPGAIVASLNPALIRLRADAPAAYEHRLRQMFSALIAISLVVAVPVSLFSGEIQQFLYGPAYRGSGPVLAIHIWNGIFVSLGIATSQWLVAEGLSLYSTIRTLIGLAINVVGNVLLIPRFGIEGAATATLLGFGFATFSILCFSRTRRGGLIVCRSLLFWRAVRTPWSV
ncbi:MAG: flippase [Proteobacteria bacterium]|nr:MAG: flippase [Pseudomonadota bacterium]